MLQKTFLKHSIIYTFISLFNRGMAFLLLPIMTRYLSPHDYGIIDFITITGSFILIICGLEIHQGIARFINDQTQDKKISLFSTSIIFIISMYVGLIIIANCLHDLVYNYLIPLSSYWLFNIVLLTYLFQSLIYYASVLLRFTLKPQINAMVNGLTAVFVIILNVIFIVYFKLGLAGAIYGLFFGSLIGLIMSFYFVREYTVLKFEVNHLKQLVKFSYPLMLSSLAVILMMYCDRIMLKHFLSLSDVGIFGVGYRLASIISILLLGVQSSLAPLIYNSLNNPRIKQEVANIFVKFSALALIGLIIIHIFGNDILHFAVNPKFATAVTTMKNMSIAILFSQLYVFTPGLQITKKTSGILYINLFGCLTNLALCYVFVKYFGLNGASFASMVSYIAVFMLYYISSQKVYPIPFPMFKILLNLAIFIAVVAFSHFFQIDLALKIILALSLSLVILALNFKPRNIFKN